MEFIDQAILHAAGQLWIYPVLLVFFFVDGFAMVVPSETLIVALAAYSRHAGEPNLWILGVTALLGAIAGDNMAYMLGRKIGLDRWKWMRRPKVRKVFQWADYELKKRGAVLIFTARYIPWGRVAVNYVAGTTRFPHRRFFVLDAFACLTWVIYSIVIGLLASSVPWLHGNPLASAGIAVAFAIVLGYLIDHTLRWWHKRLGRHDEVPARPGSLKQDQAEDRVGEGSSQVSGEGAGEGSGHGSGERSGQGSGERSGQAERGQSLAAENAAGPTSDGLIHDDEQPTSGQAGASAPAANPGIPGPSAHAAAPGLAGASAPAATAGLAGASADTQVPGFPPLQTGAPASSQTDAPGIPPASATTPA